MSGHLLRALFVLLGTSATANADWQSTRWGMGADQVKAAMNGPNITWDGECPSLPQDKISFSLHMRYTVGEFSMQGCATGAEGTGLNLVHLGLDDFTQGDALKEELLKRYGTPFRVENQRGMTKFEWHEQGDRITFDYGVLSYSGRVSKIAILKYEPLLTSTGKGL